jgi:methylenetetrahydrofolate reductase (NADPH)
MRIRELLSCGRPSISFEFFPPKDDAGFDRLHETLVSLSELRPTFVSVTYGIRQKSRRQTVRLVEQVQRENRLETMAHLTCADETREGLREVLRQISDAGVENLFVLRGDPPPGAGRFVTTPDGFAHANELVTFVRERFNFCIGGACYPEGHPESIDLDEELANTKRKIEAGCEFLITQLFFDNRTYFDFVTRARAAGIGVPIIPGIMPITNVKQISRFTKMCGVTIPEPMLSELYRRQHDPNAVLALGVAHATAQCLELLQRGAPGIHFFTLNKSLAAQTILMALQTIYPPGGASTNEGTPPTCGFHAQAPCARSA